jgi:hypothetical protein
LKRRKNRKERHNYMTLEIIGFTVKPEISIGDIAAIAALVASPLIFLFGYRRTRRSEEIRTAGDIMDKITVDYRELHEFDPENRYPWGGSEEEQRKFIREFTRYLGFILDNIIYLSHLKETKEIKNKKVVDYLSPRLLKMLNYVDISYDFVEKTPQSKIMYSIWAGYHAEIPRLKKTWGA